MKKKTRCLALFLTIILFTQFFEQIIVVRANNPSSASEGIANTINDSNQALSANGVLAGDAYETNNTLGTASTIGAAESIWANIHTANDVDYYKITVSVKTLATFALSGIPSGCNYYMSLLNSSGTSLAASNKTNNSGEFIQRWINAGTYYIKIGSSSGYSGANYRLDLCYETGKGFSSIYAGEQGVDNWGNLNYQDKAKDVFRFANKMSSAISGISSYGTERYGLQTDLKGFSGSNQSAIIYWSGHSSYKSSINGYALSYYIYRITDGYIDSSDSLFNPATYIGCTIMNWDGINGYYTNSQWDIGTKWVIFAACNQLTNSTHYNNLAKCLLGKRSRAHGILGYAETAPIGPGDYYVVNDFFAESANGDSLLTAWCEANLNNVYYVNGEPRLTNWAAICHYGNINDTLTSIYNGSSVSTSRFVLPTIRRYQSSITNYSNISINTRMIDNLKQGETSNSALKVRSLDNKTVIQDHKLALEKVNYFEDKALSLALQYALITKIFTEEQLYSMNYSVCRIESSEMDLLNETESDAECVGYAVIAYDFVDERYKEQIDDLEITKNAFVAILDSEGVCSISITNHEEE